MAETSDNGRGSAADGTGLTLSTLPPPGAAGSASPAARKWGGWPVVAMAGTGLALYAFALWSRTRPPIGFGYFTHPPIYGKWDPTWDRLALLVIPAAVLLAGTAWVVTSRLRVPSWVALTLIVGSATAAAAAVAVVRGDPDGITRGIDTSPTSPYYTADLHYVTEYGIRGFVERHPHMTTEFHSYNSRTHPAGPLLLLHGLFRVVGAGHPVMIATCIAVLGMLAAASAWLVGRELGGERAGRIAAVLFAAAPGPLMLAYTILDVVFATALTLAAALLVLAIRRDSAPFALAGGAVLGLGTLLTFATVFIALAAAVAVVIQRRDLRRIVLLLGAAAVGGLLVLALARLLIGFDLLAAFQSSPKARREYNPYWIVASPAAWLIYAGLPLAALGVAGLFRRTPGARRPVLPLVLVLIMLVWAALPGSITKLRPGEVERTWAFLYPLVAATAGIVVDRWSSRAGRWSGAVVAALVLLSVGQAVLIEGLWDNLF
ncbi:glycosyltransferase family 39 protein [Micromonospora sp. NPDC007230]|uniref:glycosyltransferase family 39 protein n=1 Tax=Micromonospora sp. NPDC007230 TaxID=3364237 RepID=UPI0036736608